MAPKTRGMARLRALLVSATVILAVCIAAASGGAASSLACGTVKTPSKVDNPSKLDYLVLASMADSPGPLAMANYSRSTPAKPGGASSGGNTPVVFR
jgi:hypothetical protein